MTHMYIININNNYYVCSKIKEAHFKSSNNFDGVKVDNITFHKYLHVLVVLVRSLICELNCKETYACVLLENKLSFW